MKPRAGVNYILLGERIQMNIKYKTDVEAELLFTIDHSSGPVHVTGTAHLTNMSRRCVSVDFDLIGFLDPVSASIGRSAFSLIVEWQGRIKDRIEKLMNDDEAILEGGYF